MKVDKENLSKESKIVKSNREQLNRIDASFNSRNELSRSRVVG